MAPKVASSNFTWNASQILMEFLFRNLGKRARIREKEETRIFFNAEEEALGQSEYSETQYNGSLIGDRICWLYCAEAASEVRLRLNRICTVCVFGSKRIPLYSRTEMHLFKSPL